MLIQNNLKIVKSFGRGVVTLQLEPLVVLIFSELGEHPSYCRLFPFYSITSRVQSVQLPPVCSYWNVKHCCVDDFAMSVYTRAGVNEFIGKIMVLAPVFTPVYVLISKRFFFCQKITRTAVCHAKKISLLNDTNLNDGPVVSIYGKTKSTHTQIGVQVFVHKYEVMRQPGKKIDALVPSNLLCPLKHRVAATIYLWANYGGRVNRLFSLSIAQ